jgi:hypothetical protein
MSALQQVHVRVNDAATGKPTPCRVHFTDAAGKYHAPYGRLTEFAISRNTDVGGNLQCPLAGTDGKVAPTRFAYIDGACEIALPPGPIEVTICKGPEYVPFQQTVDLAAGKLALRFTIQRWSDLRNDGWYPGDIRCHFLPPHAALLEGAAEDLAVVNVLVCNDWILDDMEGWIEPVSRPSLSNILAFSGQTPALEQPGCMVVVNTYHRHVHLGSLALLNCHRVVYPLTFGRPFEGEGYDNWTLADWCEQCHRKRGLVVWTDTDMSRDYTYPESLADAILGKVDAVEVAKFDWRGERHPWPFYWYDLLNCGLRLPLAGGSAKASNYLPVGCVRTYARLQPGQPITYQHWIEAVRDGRTFATNAPLLRLTVEDQEPGGFVHLAAERPLRVRAEAQSQVVFEHLEIVVNGEVAAHQAPGGNLSAAVLDAEIRVPRGGWVAARCWGTAWLPGYGVGQRVYAHTSPVYVRFEGKRPPVDQAAVQRFIDHLATMVSWVNNEGRYENDAQRLRLRKIFEDAIVVLRQRGV